MTDTNLETTAAEDSEKLEGIDSAFHEVVKKYGRDMFATVMNAGLAQQGMQVLAVAADKHRSQHSLHAVAIVSQAFNQIANELIKLHNWDEGTLAQCDRDIQLAFAGKIQIPGQSPIILDS